jgi:NAD(P)-dependent dehydrogenase (short-subunit alcohol dehydrogenase family)
VVRKAREAFGRIDVLVNNAGYGLFGGAEEVTDEQLRRQIETNLIGSIQLTRAVLPLLREQGSGHIIQISSQGGQVTFPGLSLYHATKWGIEGFCEALAGEVAALGIQVTIVEPGGIRTDWRGRSMDFATPLDAYAQTALGQIRHRASQRTGNTIPGDPAKMAEAIVSVASQSSAPLRLTLGSDAYQAVRAALQARLAALDAQEALARSTDADVITGNVQ